jgi:branched-chain amino acid transport system substrate-binding protein
MAFKRLLTASTLIACGLTIGLSGCSNNIPDVIKIGAAQPLTGNKAGQGQDLLNGVKLAVAELNKEGFKVKGKLVTLEVVAVDDRADPKTGVEVAQQLVDAGVVAVVGHLNSGVSIPAAPIYAASNIAQLAISTNPKYTAQGLPTTIRLVGNDILQAKAIGSFAVNQLNANKYAVANDGTTYSKGLADDALAQLKLAKKEVVFNETFDKDSIAMDGLAQKLKEGNVEVFITTQSDFQVIALIGALKKINYTNLKIMGGDTLKTTPMFKVAGIMAGIYASSPILEAAEFASGKEFLAKYRAAYKIDPEYAGHYTYDAVYAIAAAIKRAQSVNPTDITAALHKMDLYAPVTGSYRFDEAGEQRYGAIAVYSLGAGRWESLIRSDVW